MSAENESIREHLLGIIQTMYQKIDIAHDGVSVIESKSLPARSKIMHGNHALRDLHELVTMAALLIQSFQNTSTAIHGIMGEAIAEQYGGKKNEENAERSPIGFNPVTPADVDGKPTKESMQKLFDMFKEVLPKIVPDAVPAVSPNPVSVPAPEPEVEPEPITEPKADPKESEEEEDKP